MASGMIGDWFVKALIVQYALASVAYLWHGQDWKALYFAGAFVISIAVLGMKG